MTSKPAVIVIGASAGGIEPLIRIVRDLPADLPAAVCIVVHFPPTSVSMLSRILARSGVLPVAEVDSSQPVQAGCIYVAPQDQHLLLLEGGVVVSRGPQENGHRPAIDPLFRTAAHSFAPRVIGVVLSGTLDDGVRGLEVIKAHGGMAIVQDPDEAVFDSMPRSALASVEIDRVLPAAAIGPALVELAGELAQMPDEQVAERERRAMSQVYDDDEAAVVAEDKAALERGERPGQPTMFTCPDCGGVLWELNDGKLLRYRCHVGHAYSVESLREHQAIELEVALWTAIRALEESAALARRMAFRARSFNNHRTAERFDQRARADEQRASLVRQALSAGLAVGGAPQVVDVAAEVSE